MTLSNGDKFCECKDGFSGDGLNCRGWCCQNVIEYEVGHRPGLGSVICGAYIGLYIAIQGISDNKLC